VPFLEQCISLALDGGYCALATDALTHLTRADRARGYNMWNRTLAQIRGADDIETLSRALEMLTATLVGEGDYERAVEAGREGLEAAQRNRQEPLPWIQIESLHSKLGVAEYHLGHYDAAVHHFEESMRVERVRNIDSPTDRAVCHYFLAYVALAHGNQAEAERLSREALRYAAVGGLDLITVLVLAQQADLAQRAGDVTRAGRLFGMAEQRQSDVYRVLWPFLLHEYRRTLTAAQDQLSDPVFAAAWAEGHRMTLEQAIDEARGLPPGG
jgi:hypothetical protein